MKHLLFIVPARGGSKGFPGKNLAPLHGRPLIAHVLRAARRAIADLTDARSRLLVSTDDAAIAAVAKRHGAEVPFLRPAELAEDASSDIDALLHALDWLRDAGERDPDVVIELQAPSPLVSVEDILAALRQFTRYNGAAVVSLGPSAKPVEWTVTLEGDHIRPLLPSVADRPRQTFQQTYCFNGAISIISPEQLRRERTFLTPDTVGYVMPAERSVDIDTALDLRWAEVLYEQGARPTEAVTVANGVIGPGHPCFVIAEAGVNHNGSVDLAHRLVDAAAAARVDAVKFQTFRPELLCAPDAPKESYQVVTTGDQESQLKMLEGLVLSEEAHHQLKQHAESLGLLFLSTPFDEPSADYLDTLGVPAFKIGSGEVTHLPLLRHVGGKRRPVLLSTGMSTLQEVSAAVDTLQQAGDPPLILLHCVSCYPCEPADSNLRAMDTLRRTFGVPVGFSDHTLGAAVPLAAVARGANALEKHLTLDVNLPGPDHKASLEPRDFKALVHDVRAVERSIGDGQKQPAPAEEEGRRLGRRSLCAAVTIRKGELISREKIAVLRPGDGIPPAEIDAWIGRLAPRDFAPGMPFSDR